MMTTMMKPIATICSSSSSRRRKVSRRVSSSSSLPSSHIRRPLLSFPNLHPRSQAPSPSSSPSPSTDFELHLLLDLLPPGMRAGLYRHGELKDLVEVVMDLGRRPLARFPSGDLFISDSPVEAEDLRHAVTKVGDFSDDNRSGLDRSLHRISAIRNRKMQIIGLTCRVGRAVSGSARMIGDLIRSGFSILVIGPPGVGKTTLIREIARLLADEQMKRVVIVDTSNEIGGDGDIPHAGIGRARRMQVPNVNMQHDVMIEAVENHMPEVIVIDEIGTELEAMAASTIAQRGVQLVATAHGVTIGSIMKNPSLQILVGGIESVTLGDEEARKRKVRKTILERKGPPTFTCAVEMISKTECRVHHKLESTVDAILAGKTPCFEVRCMGAQNDDFIEDIPVHNPAYGSPSTFNEDVQAEVGNLSLGIAVNHTSILSDEDKNGDDSLDATGRHAMGGNNNLSDKSCPTRVYVFKIREADLLQVAEVMGLESEIDVTEDIGTANAILVSYSELKQNPWIRSVAKFYSLLVFVIKKNTMAQMVKAVQMILKPNGPLSKVSANPPAVDIEIDDDAPTRKPSLEEIDALEEVRMAIEYIVIPGGEPVELLPRCSEIIARQLELVESYQLAAELSGTEFNSRLQILPQKMKKGRSSVGHANPNKRS